MPCPSAAQNTGAKICRHILCRQTDSLANQQAVLADGTAAHMGKICGFCTVWACLSVCFELDWPGPVACHPGPGPGPGPGSSRVLSSCFRTPAPRPPPKKKTQNVRILSRAGQNPNRGVSGSAERSEHLRPNLWQTKVSKKKKKKKKKNVVFIKKRVSLDTVCNFSPKKHFFQQNSSTSSSETRFL